MSDGEVAAIQVIDRLGPCKGFTSCYDENWQLIENVNIYYSKGAYQPPPEGLKEMAEKAKELSKACGIFCRIDFYATDKGALFGEFTPTPFMGSFFTPEADKSSINYWDRFCKRKILSKAIVWDTLNGLYNYLKVYFVYREYANY